MGFMYSSRAIVTLFTVHEKSKIRLSYYSNCRHRKIIVIFVIVGYQRNILNNKNFLMYGVGYF